MRWAREERAKPIEKKAGRHPFEVQEIGY